MDFSDQFCCGSLFRLFGGICGRLAGNVLVFAAADRHRRRDFRFTGGIPAVPGGVVCFLWSCVVLGCYGACAAAGAVRCPWECRLLYTDRSAGGSVFDRRYTGSKVYTYSHHSDFIDRRSKNCFLRSCCVSTVVFPGYRTNAGRVCRAGTMRDRVPVFDNKKELKEKVQELFNECSRKPF